MSRIGRLYLKRKPEPKIGIAPLIDMVFILLIFFLVSTSFVKETGITVDKPVAVSAKTLEKQSILIAVTNRGTIHINQRMVDLGGLESVVKKTLRRFPSRPVVIIADRKADTGRVVDVMDRCKLAGVKKVSLASSKK